MNLFISQETEITFLLKSNETMMHDYTILCFNGDGSLLCKVEPSDHNKYELLRLTRSLISKRYKSTFIVYVQIAELDDDESAIKMLQLENDVPNYTHYLFGHMPFD